MIRSSLPPRGRGTALAVEGAYYYQRCFRTKYTSSRYTGDSWIAPTKPYGLYTYLSLRGATRVVILEQSEESRAATRQSQNTKRTLRDCHADARNDTQRLFRRLGIRCTFIYIIKKKGKGKKIKKNFKKVIKNCWQNILDVVLCIGCRTKGTATRD